MFFDIFCFFCLFYLFYLFLFNNSVSTYLFFFLSTVLTIFFFCINDTSYYLFWNFYFFEIPVLVTLFSTFFTFFLLLLVRSPLILKNSIFHLLVLLLISLNIIFSNSLIVIFFFFELLLLVSINLLRVTSKSERVLEAINEMYFWTLFGSLFLIIGIFNYYIVSSYTIFNNLEFKNFLGFFFLIGFGVKVPLWPFTSWLLKAHVEASTEFSILLSGFIIKLGIISLVKILNILENNNIFLILSILALIGIIDACVKLLYQQDLKKIVALTTIIEVNWLILCYAIGGSTFLFLSNYLLIVHSFTTTLEFLLVDSLVKRYGSRDINYISGIWFHTPNLWYVSFFTILITIGFPGTSIFFAKIIFFSYLLQFSFYLFIVLVVLFFLYLPIFFIRLWLPLWFGLSKKNIIFDLSKKEFFIFIIFILINLIVGFLPLLLFLG